MFDSYRIDRGPSHVSVHTEVTEKRAPTDESVRLLREMEAKAFGQVLEQINVSDNAFSGKLFRHIQGHIFTEQLTCVFSLNGKKHTASVEADEDRLKTYRALAKEMAEVIARETLIPLLAKDSRK